MAAPTFTMPVKSKSGKHLNNQAYTFSEDKDTIKIGDFTLVRDITRGQWVLSFPVDGNLKEVSNKIALPSEIASNVATIRLSSLTITHDGNIEFALESLGSRAVVAKKFTITPNSVKFKNAATKLDEEMFVCPDAEVMDVTFPKNIVEIINPQAKIVKTSGSLPQELFESIYGNAFFEPKADSLEIENTAGQKLKFIKVGNTFFACTKGEMKEFNTTQIHHTPLKDGASDIGINLNRDYYGTKFVSVDATNQLKLANFLGITADWNNPSYTFDPTSTASARYLAHEFVTNTITKSTGDSTLVPPPPPPPQAKYKKEADGKWHELSGGVYNPTAVSYKGQEGEKGHLPTIDATSKTYIIEGAPTSYLAESSDGRKNSQPVVSGDNKLEIAGEKFDDVLYNGTEFYRVGADAGDYEVKKDPSKGDDKFYVFINGINTEIEGTNQDSIILDPTGEWKFVLTSTPPAYSNIPALRAAGKTKAVGEKGASAKIEIDPTSENFTIGGVDTKHHATVKERTKIEQDGGFWKINGVTVPISCQGKDATLPVIGADRKWIIEGKPTEHLAMNKKGEHHPIPEQDATSGEFKIGATTYPEMKGQVAEIPHIDAATNHWFINGIDSGLDGDTPITLNSANEWREDDGTPDGKKITALAGNASALGKDGISPTIGANGNFFLGSKDTGSSAVMKEKEEEKSSTSSDNSKPDFDLLHPFLIGLGLVFTLLSVLTGFLGFLAFGTMLFATPSILKEASKVSKAAKEKGSSKTKNKNYNKQLAKQKRRELRCFKAVTRVSTLDPEWQEAANQLFHGKPPRLTKEARSALKRIDVKPLLIKAQKWDEKITQTRAYLQKLQADASLGSAIATQLATPITQALNDLSTAETYQRDIASQLQRLSIIKTFAELSTATPKQVGCALYSLCGSSGTVLNATDVFDPGSGHSIANDATMCNNLMNKITDIYLENAQTVKDYIGPAGTVEQCLDQVAEILDQNDLTEKRDMEYTKADEGSFKST